MKVSLSKLEKFIQGLGYVPKRYLVIKKVCVYIEVISVRNANTFLIYIPSKYSIRIKERDNIFDISYMDINADGTMVNEYAKDPDEFALENIYENIEIDQGNNSVGIIDKLEENYKRHLTLKEEDDNIILMDIFRQLRRLRYCVQTMAYKLCIIYKNYMCCIHRDDSFQGYKIDDYSKDNTRRLIVTTDMESLYERNMVIDSDLYMINSGINRILDRNQGIQADVLKRMMEAKNNVVATSEVIYGTKKKYTIQLESLREMLDRLSPVENSIIENIININERHNANDNRTLHSDLEHTRTVSELEDKLSKLNITKQEIIHNILEIQNRRDNISLTVDKIMFDNSVMLDTIYRNFEKLGKII